MPIMLAYCDCQTGGGGVLGPLVVDGAFAFLVDESVGSSSSDLVTVFCVSPVVASSGCASVTAADCVSRPPAGASVLVA